MNRVFPDVPLKAVLAGACLAFGLASAHAANVVSTSFTVTGAVKQAMTFDLAALKALTPVTLLSGGNTYVGVSFWDLLTTTVGLTNDPNVKNSVNQMVVVATGTDNYSQTFSLGELNPAFGNQPDLIAYSLNGSPITADGFARVIVPNDGRAGRWVSNLASLQVINTAVTPVPEPATWALSVAGLLAVGALARRRMSH